MKRISPQIKVTFIYTVFGVLWIFFSDRFLLMWIAEPETLSQLQTTKGWIYVIVTFFLLYALIKRDYQIIEKKETEKQKIFNATLRAVHQILNNFLNGMMLMKLEAGKSQDFDKEVLNMYDRSIKDAQTQLKDLNAVSDISEAQIKKVMELV